MLCVNSSVKRHSRSKSSRLSAKISTPLSCVKWIKPPFLTEILMSGAVLPIISKIPVAHTKPLFRRQMSPQDMTRIISILRSVSTEKSAERAMLFRMTVMKYGEVTALKFSSSLNTATVFISLLSVPTVRPMTAPKVTEWSISHGKKRIKSMTTAGLLK